MAWLSIKRIFKQHASRVVTLPPVMCRGLELDRGDYLVFEWDEKKKFMKVYKWHKGVERSYADYGATNLRNQGGRK